jgi:hypothetical protein
MGRFGRMTGFLGRFGSWVGELAALVLIVIALLVLHRLTG